jgi:hypothetical protein
MGSIKRPAGVSRMHASCAVCLYIVTKGCIQQQQQWHDHQACDVWPDLLSVQWLFADTVNYLHDAHAQGKRISNAGSTT